MSKKSATGQTLRPPQPFTIQTRTNDREQFIKDNQEAFKYGATEEFGVRDEHFEEDGEIISIKIRTAQTADLMKCSVFKKF